MERKSHKTEYHPSFKISHQVFMKAASDVLGINEDFLSLHRQVMMGEDWGKLTVNVYKTKKDKGRYWDRSVIKNSYKPLPTNIEAFKTALLEKSLSHNYPDI